jgi:hypothetical protein
MNNDQWEKSHLTALTAEAIGASTAQINDPRRGQFAAMAMQGMLSHGTGATPEILASYAVIYADALLAELAK